MLGRQLSHFFVYLMSVWYMMSGPRFLFVFIMLNVFGMPLKVLQCFSGRFTFLYREM